MFEITKLSYSAISTFDGCETDYYCRYLLNLPGLDNKGQYIGIGVHKVLECLCNLEKQVKEGKKLPVVKDEYAGNVYKTTPIHKLIDRVYKSIVAKTPQLNWEDKDRKKYEKLIQVGLESKNSPYGNTIVETEKYFNIQLTEYPWANIGTDKYLSISGVIDVYYINNNGEHCILDYKTGKPEHDWNANKKMVYNDYYSSTQLCMYYFALRKLYKDIEPIIKIWYLQNDKLITIYFTDDVISYVEDFLKKSFDKIRGLEKPKQNRSFKCKQFCSWGKQKFSDIGRPDLAIVNRTDNFITKTDEEMTICEAIHAFQKFRSIDKITEKCKVEKDKK